MRATTYPLLPEGDPATGLQPEVTIPKEVFTSGARLAFGAKDQQWEVAVFGRNLPDEYYWPSVHNWADAIVRYAGMPRTYGIEFTLDID